MATYKERYAPVLIGVNGTFLINNDSVGGFLCKTAGAITVTRVNQISGASEIIVDAHPVTAGTYFPIPFYLGPRGGVFTASGGASGTLGY